MLLQGLKDTVHLRESYTYIYIQFRTVHSKNQCGWKIKSFTIGHYSATFM